MQTPDLYEYADYRRYLSDWFEARKAADPDCSHRWFARRLNVTDPSVLHNILSHRRRLTNDRIDAFAKALELAGDDAAYFRALVEFGQAKNADTRNKAFGVLAELRSRHLPPEVDPARFSFLHSWVVPAIRELARLPHFREDAAWIATQLDPPVTAVEAARALALVERLGFLRREEGKLVAADPMLRTTETVATLASYPYHRDAHTLGARALQRVHDSGQRATSETGFVGCTLSVPNSRLPELRAQLYEMASKLAHLTENWADEADRVVQVSINLFPVTRAPDDT
jgi:uncharacterized protein (TIGR02147 family)